MAGGFVSSTKGDGSKEYPGKMTWFVLFTCIIGAFGGLIFGYDIGISGGVTSMPSFLKKFFPAVYRKEQGVVATNQYCTYDSATLTIFTSSLYLAALVASFVASMVTRKYGRSSSMFLGGVIFLLGSALNGAALNIAMLIIGRILLGFGVGFANQSVPLYLSEMAPSRHRGALNIVFQMMVTIGILAANLVNYGTNKIQSGWGWRLSLALAAVPAGVITIGSLFLPDTPNSLIERGKSDKAEDMLRKIRGTDDVKDEFNDLFAASEASKSVENPWRNILERRYRPQLVMAIAIPLFQQLTGINVIMFYAPVFFKTIGFGGDASLMSAVITGGANVFATFLAIIFADKLGRRILFIAGGILMLICQAVVGSLIWWKFGVTGAATQVTKVYANVVVGFICVYVSAFAWSWGPLGWLVPSEIFPLEIRSAGQSINVAVNMFFTFIIAQIFLNMLCHLKFGLFYLFAFFVSVMTVFVYYFLPETKGIPIEEMTRVWRKHWFWKRYVPLEDDDVAAGEIEIGNPKNMLTATR